MMQTDEISFAILSIFCTHIGIGFSGQFRDKYDGQFGHPMKRHHSVNF